jgi:hemerythrin-like metal-binding protein
MMDSFQWGKSFLTGLDTIDDQHHHLVDLINKFGSSLTENKVNLVDVAVMFKELAHYSDYHFKAEEQLMAEVGVDQRHIVNHKRAHSSFLEDAGVIFADISRDNSEVPRRLLDYLIHWLAYHILGQDQSMARQIEAIKSGLSPEDAYLKGVREQDETTEILLKSLNSLFEQVRDRNKMLVELNASLKNQIELINSELEQLRKQNQADM